jgi:hypothetical protein
MGARALIAVISLTALACLLSAAYVSSYQSNA